MTKNLEIRTNPPEWLTIMESAQFLNCSDRKVRELVHDGELNASKTGREYRIHITWIREFLERNRIDGPMQSKTTPPRGYDLLNPLDVVQPRPRYYKMWSEAYHEWVNEPCTPMFAGMTQQEADTVYAKPRGEVK